MAFGRTVWERPAADLRAIQRLAFVPDLFSFGAMADDDDLRDLTGRLTAAQRQGFHVTPAHIRLLLAALRFYIAARTWLAKPHTDPHDDAPRKLPEKYTGPPATIADLRKLGLMACQVQCAGPNCWHAMRVTFDALRLGETDFLTDVPRMRRFLCSRCGCRMVRVSPDWTDHKAQGNGRPVSQ